jgi:hypothetical protein
MHQAQSKGEDIALRIAQKIGSQESQAKHITLLF